tara:strand:- start:1237 stop:1338 length:102 start_codon:yes stop_codon:yes gene_type:complete
LNKPKSPWQTKEWEKEEMNFLNIQKIEIAMRYL